MDGGLFEEVIPSHVHAIDDVKHYLASTIYSSFVYTEAALQK